MNNVSLLFPDYYCHFQNLPINNKELIKHLQDIEYNKTFSSKGCYTSNTYDFLKTIDKNYEEVFVDYIQKGFDELGIKSNFKIARSWITKVTPDSESEYHNHANYFMSAVYYPMGAQDNSINFRKTLPTLWDVETSDNFLHYQTQTVLISAGDLILFPSHLLHRVNFNSTNTNRYSIAMNIQPTGVIGTFDSKYEFST